MTLTFDPKLLQHFRCHMFKLCTKFEQNQSNDPWQSKVIDDLAHFCIAILRIEALSPESSQGFVDLSSLILGRTYSDHRCS